MITDQLDHIWKKDDYDPNIIMINHGIIIHKIIGTNEYFELDHIWNRKYFDDKEHFHGKIDFFFKLQKICSRGASAARVRFSP